MTDSQRRTPERHEEDDDGSFVDELKEKVKDLLEDDEAADYDTLKTNPVTGQRRDPSATDPSERR